MAKENSDAMILRELEPVVAKELNDHEERYENWYPHDYVPWSEGKNYYYLGGKDWEPTESKLGQAAQAAMYVNLLTEDNLPSYHREISSVFGRDSAWGEWVDRWTAEENKHGIAMRDYLVVTRAVDPIELEIARMTQVTSHYRSGDKSPLEAVAYVTIQELATRIAHRNTGLESKKDGDDLADQLLGRIAKDENLHMVFYRNIGKAALEIAASEMIQAISKEVVGFQMPGATSIPEFWPKAALISDAEIYDLDIHANKIVKPVLKFWKIDQIKDAELTDEAKLARDKLHTFMKGLDSSVDKLRAAREAQKEAAEH